MAVGMPRFSWNQYRDEPVATLTDGVGKCWSLFAQYDCDRGLPEACRLDFAFILMGEMCAWVNVEADGHDFHDRTKEQAQRDRRRDRILVARGFRVLRFTGSEIYRNAAHCADEILHLLSVVEGIDLDAAVRANERANGVSP